MLGRFVLTRGVAEGDEARQGETSAFSKRQRTSVSKAEAPSKQDLPINFPLLTVNRRDPFGSSKPTLLSVATKRSRSGPTF